MEIKIKNKLTYYSYKDHQDHEIENVVIEIKEGENFLTPEIIEKLENFNQKLTSSFQTGGDFDSFIIDEKNLIHVFCKSFNPEKKLIEIHLSTSMFFKKCKDFDDLQRVLKKHNL